MGWWFGRILTFEIEADEEPPTVGLVLSDASGSWITAGSDRTLAGYAAYGRSIKEAIKPLVEAFGVDLFDDGEVLRPQRLALPCQSRSTILAIAPRTSRCREFTASRFRRVQCPRRCA